MTAQPAANAAADLRWQEWVARGAASDRRTTRRMNRLMLLIAIGFGIWSSVAIFIG